MGAFDGKGGIMKPLRVSGQIEWYALFTYLSVVNSYSLDRESHVVGCGYYTGSGDTSAGIFRMQNDGHLQWFLQVTPEAANFNLCYGIHYDDTLDWSYALFLTTSSEFSTTGFEDLAILIFDNVGNLKKGKKISLGANVQFNSKTENSFLLPLGDQFIFAGATTGFTTELQSETFTNSKTNVFVMKY